MIVLVLLSPLFKDLLSAYVPPIRIMVAVLSFKLGQTSQNRQCMDPLNNRPQDTSVQLSPSIKGDTITVEPCQDQDTRTPGQQDPEDQETPQDPKVSSGDKEVPETHQDPDILKVSIDKKSKKRFRVSEKWLE